MRLVDIKHLLFLRNNCNFVFVFSLSHEAFRCFQGANKDIVFSFSSLLICYLLHVLLFPTDSFWISQFSCSLVSDSLQPHGLQRARPPLSITNSQSLIKLMSIALLMPSNHLILCHPLLFLPSVLSSIRVFSSESVLHIRWPKYWTFSISPSNEYSGLISFTMDWLDLLAVQGTLKSLLQHHSSKASVLWLWAFFIVQLSHPYVTTGKTIALTRRAFVDKVNDSLLPS